jgi:hypothetical protein
MRDATGRNWPSLAYEQASVQFLQPVHFSGWIINIFAIGEPPALL